MEPRQSDSSVRIGQLEIRFLIDETQSAGQVVMFEFVVPPRARVPAPHYHRDVDELVYGLEGSLTTTIGQEKRTIGVGCSAYIPRGIVHHHENLSGQLARVLCVMTPGSIGRRYFEEIAAEVNVPGKPDLARIKEIMFRHGLVPA
jgi:quercetin dioxygenase-like cupin family protein